MTPNIVISGLGAILLLVGIVGGGFEIKEFKIPRVGTAPRVLAAIAGVVFLLLGIGLGGPDTKANAEPPGNTDPTGHSPHKPASFKIYDRLGPDRLSEQITVFIRGEFKGELKADVTSPESVLPVTVPHPGTYSYWVSATMTVNDGGELKTYSGTGEGSIHVEDGKSFYLIESISGNTWLVSMTDDTSIISPP